MKIDNEMAKVSIRMDGFFLTTGLNCMCCDQ